ncbi:MAG: CapA family protein, partial [Clostridia bacterium]|nr:CapA family protein [Clostridia bacterium]
PLFNSPSDMGMTLVKEGFDVVLHASNHILDRQASGVEHTLAFWENYPGVRVLGINKSEEEKQQVEIATVKGANIALLNYTYGTNGISLPSDKSYLVNYIDEEKIMQDALYAEENADFTVAFMHWGTEYSTKPDAAQKALALKMCEWGVDLIVGSHPHVIEPVEWVRSENGNSMLVFYSLGNFVSRQKEARNLLGAIADVELTYDGEGVFISDYAFVPIVTHYDRNSANFAVYPLKEYTDELATQHGINLYDGPASVDRWTKMVNRVFDGYDRSKVDLPVTTELILLEDQ